MQKAVAIIDDDPDDLEIMEQVIQDIDPGFACRRFIDPTEGIDELLATDGAELPAVIFIDINMPGLRGDKCLEILRAHALFDEVEIVMYSTSMPEKFALTLKSAGANHIFEKPVSIQDYNDILTSILSPISGKIA